MSERPARKAGLFYLMLKTNRFPFIISVTFFSMLILAIVTYWSGLAGGFLFDDFANLDALGKYGTIDDLQSFIDYVFGGGAGPRGRPLSLLSFLIDDNAWPSQPWQFKYTNLFLHLLNGVLLFWLLYKLLDFRAAANNDVNKAPWIALLACSLWLLHPFLVSTTLFVVQRMAMLAALFSLLGLLCYVHGRTLLQSHPRRAYVWMTSGVVLGTILATLSKENGALLPLLVLILEYTALRNTAVPSDRLSQVWRLIFLWLPVLTIIAYVTYRFPSLLNGYGIRSFSMGERLLTEGRILMEYLYHLSLPHPYTRGLFHDSYAVSTGLFTPPSTFWSWIAILALIFGSFLARHRFPLWSLAILFFFAGHLLESTIVPLELYFEHRNYLPAMFLFLPVAHGTVRLGENNKLLSIAVAACLTVYLTTTTAQRADLWGHPDELILLWAEKNPYSPRAQRSAAIALDRMGNTDLALQGLERAIRDIPDNLPLRLHHLIIKSLYTGVSADELKQTRNLVSKLPYDFRTYKLLEAFVEVVISKRTLGITPDDAHELLNSLADNPMALEYAGPRRQLLHLHGVLYAAQKKPAKALESFDRSLDTMGDVEAGLLQVAILASHKMYAEALAHLATTQLILRSAHENQLKHSREFYASEMARLEEVIKADLQRSSL